MKARIDSIKYEHPEHGSFTVFLNSHCVVTAIIRVFGALPLTETVRAPLDCTRKEARALIVARIAQLDAEAEQRRNAAAADGACTCTGRGTEARCA